MNPVARYPSSVKQPPLKPLWAETKGKIIRIKGQHGIMFKILDQPCEKVNHVTVRSIPNGTESDILWPTLRDWIHAGKIEVVVAEEASC